MENLDPLLAELCVTQSHSKSYGNMIFFIAQKIRAMGLSPIISNGNIYVTKGTADIYPCMVCHTDTVHTKVDKVELYRSGDNVFNMDPATVSQIGTGGDDKCGIYVTLKLLESQPYMKAVFFREEEIGLLGAKAADGSFFEDCGFILECDRKGNSDFVTSSIKSGDLSGVMFQEHIAETLEKYGYKHCKGGGTDVVALKQFVGIAMANISCGYYRPHKDTEYINLTDLRVCLELCTDLFASMQGLQFVFYQNTAKARCTKHRLVSKFAYQKSFYCTQCKATYSDQTTAVELITTVPHTW